MNDRFKFRVWWNSPFVNEESKYLYYNPNEFCHTTDIVRDASCDSVEDIVYYDIRDIILGDIDEFEKPNTFIVEQCTGLKDKNGNLIYEGDIVEITIFGSIGPNGGYVDSDEIYKGTVVWDRDCFLVKSDTDDMILFPHSEDCTEIVGNIHEQPEQKDK